MICPNCFVNQLYGDTCPSCGFRLTSYDNRTDLRMFSRLKNRYVVGRSLGTGGFGITYSAFDTTTDTRVAVKEYFPSGMVLRDMNGVSVQYTHHDRFSEFRHGFMRFKEEAEIIYKLSTIAGIVKVIDAFDENGTSYYVMEYIDGISLKKLVSKNGMDINLANEIIKNIGMTIDIMHKDYGYLHRDISPENIMITDDNRSVLIDFGSAKNFFFENNNYTITLKHGFAPIEQYSSADIQGPYTDLYALAGTYYFMLTGSIIPRATDRLAGMTYVPLYQVNPDIPREVSDAVDRALMLRRTERTQTVGRFLRELEMGFHQTGSLHKERSAFVAIDGKPSAELKIEDDKEIIIGRSHSKCDIIVEDDCVFVSNIHCRLMYDSKLGQFCLEDTSANGTYINHNKMIKNQKYYIRTNDQINLANSRYRLILKECIVK